MIRKLFYLLVGLLIAVIVIPPLYFLLRWVEQGLMIVVLSVLIAVLAVLGVVRHRG